MMVPVVACAALTTLSLLTKSTEAKIFKFLNKDIDTKENNSKGCADPLAAIHATLNCIEKEDVPCSAKGYDTSAFRKLHNGFDTNTTINDEFWSIAFKLVDLKLDINHAFNVQHNQASIRYDEIVIITDGSDFDLPPSTDYPFNQTYHQHEHAIVTVDDDCRMILWDQYGDNEEQTAVDVVARDVLCAIEFLPVEVCGKETASKEMVVSNTMQESQSQPGGITEDSKQNIDLK